MSFLCDKPLQMYSGRRFPPVRPRKEDHTDESKESDCLYEVRIIDNDHNTYREVMDITMDALDITEDLAFSIAWEVDHMGSCVVAKAPKSEADGIAGVIRTIGIEVQVNPVKSDGFQVIQ
ncbi:MAG: ATP-dependent Clp protease adaptor ClpS [Thermodesulfobacteriota bacterium]